MPNTRLTVCGTSFTVSPTQDAPGHCPVTRTGAECVVVAGAFSSAYEVRAAWRAQTGTDCPI